MSCPLEDIVVVSATSSQGVVHETDDTPAELNVEDDIDRNVLSMFDKYLNGKLKHLDGYDDDDEDEGSDDDVRNNMNDSVCEHAANYLQTARKRRGTDRRSSVFGNILNSSRSKSSFEVVQLLRHYYEVEKNQSFVSSYAEENINLPVDFDSINLDEGMLKLYKLMDEVKEKHQSVPKEMIENERNDLKVLVKLFHDSRSEIMKKSSQPSSQVEDGNEDSEVKNLTKQLSSRIKSIKELQMALRDRLESLENLQSVPLTSSNSLF